MSGRSIFIMMGTEWRREKRGVKRQKDPESERDSEKCIFLWLLSKSYKTEQILNRLEEASWDGVTGIGLDS